MTITTSLLLLTAICVGLFYWTARHGTRNVTSDSQLESNSQPIDLEIFSNLLDLDQISYVRSRLSANEFAWYERERSRVILEYVKRISHNAALVIGYAHHLPREHQNDDLLALGLKVRFQCLWIMFLLNLKIIFPSTSVPIADLLTSYSLVRKQSPALR
jgi:hypothetical protein